MISSNLNYETMFMTDYLVLSRYLTRRSYPLTYERFNFQLSKRELEVIIALVRGWHAGEISDKLKIKQTTVESYIQNIKDKLGVNLKSELISMVLEKNLLSQVYF